MKKINNWSAKLIPGIVVFVFTYLSVWFAFWAMAELEKPKAPLYEFTLGLFSSFGYAAFLVSIPVQIVAQSILQTLGIVRHETMGVVSYPLWVAFLITSSTITLIALALLSLPSRRKNKINQK